jgi:acyl carrier protein
VSIELSTIYERLTEILREQFDDDTLVATPGLMASQVAGWDSFAHLLLMFAVEKQFKVKFAASEMSSLKNVGELADLVQAKSA